MNKMKYRHIFTYWIRIQLFWENETEWLYSYLGNVLDSMARCFKQMWEVIINLKKMTPYLFTTNLFSSLNTSYSSDYNHEKCFCSGHMNRYWEQPWGCGLNDKFCELKSSFSPMTLSRVCIQCKNLELDLKEKIGYLFT